jgi:predicted nuclease of predicted toxin-antitoxin system
MALRFFADQCVPTSIVQSLREAGHEVLVLREHLPIEAVDPDAIERAQALDAILIHICILRSLVGNSQ